jgi:hypothetical protein
MLGIEFHFAVPSFATASQQRTYHLTSHGIDFWVGHSVWLAHEIAKYFAIVCVALGIIAAFISQGSREGEP